MVAIMPREIGWGGVAKVLEHYRGGLDKYCIV